MPTPQMVNCQRIECSFDHFVGLTLKGIKVSKTLPSTQWNLFDVWLLSFKWSCQKLLKQLFGVGFKKSSNYLNYLKYSRIFPGHLSLTRYQIDWIINNFSVSLKNVQDTSGQWQWVLPFRSYYEYYS